jgi:hypothetical protein
MYLTLSAGRAGAAGGAAEDGIADNLHQAVLVPHMLTALSTYLDRLAEPDFSPGGVPLSSLMPVTGELLPCFC